MLLIIIPDAEIVVSFSDGFKLTVPANKMATSKDVACYWCYSVQILTKLMLNGSVNLSVTTTGSGITKVEFYDETTLIGTKTERSV